MIVQDKIDTLKSGIDAFLSRCESALATQVFAEEIPVVGEGLRSAYEGG